MQVPSLFLPSSPRSCIVARLDAGFRLGPNVWRHLCVVILSVARYRLTLRSGAHAGHGPATVAWEPLMAIVHRWQSRRRFAFVHHWLATPPHPIAHWSESSSFSNVSSSLNTSSISPSCHSTSSSCTPFNVWLAVSSKMDLLGACPALYFSA